LQGCGLVSWEIWSVRCESGKNKCAANVCQLVGGFAALLFLRSVGLRNFHVSWFWWLSNLGTVTHSMPHNVWQIGDGADF